MMAGGMSLKTKTIADELSVRTRPSPLHRPLDKGRLECHACGQRCPISPGFLGVCKVRFVRDGKLYAPYGYVNAAFSDPIEKKPFFHVFPGSSAFSFGMLGCNLHCAYCQNWRTTQALRDVRSTVEHVPVTPEELVTRAQLAGAKSIISTYNEPLITAEWAVAVFRQAKVKGLTTGFISNGNATHEVLEYIHPWVDLYKVDLKSFRDRHYRDLGARIGPILDSIEQIYTMGFWLEIVTLVIPDFNDSDQELRDMAEFISRISPDIPWHVTAFHPDYRMPDTSRTPPETLLRAASIGRAAGLRYVYAGNLPGAAGDWENTRCPNCAALLVERRGYRILRNRLEAGRCPGCATPIPGRGAATAGASADPTGLLHIRCG
jgi:pyruvate formate lyase activating enzyme